ncbi:MAG: hypothetical protein IK062_03910 [Selenomonadaceae bacterium]|nr:hypothetical protein [Selenomonadaceae bacterium]
MKIFKVKLTESINDIRFGTIRKDVRVVLGSNFEEIKKTPFSKNTMDAYNECNVFYTPDNRLIAMEIFSDETEIIVDGEKLPKDYKAAVKWIKGKDPTYEEDSESLTSKKFSVSIYLSENKIDGALFAEAGYFE